MTSLLAWLLLSLFVVFFAIEQAALKNDYDCVVVALKKLLRGSRFYSTSICTAAI